MLNKLKHLDQMDKLPEKHKLQDTKLTQEEIDIIEEIDNLNCNFSVELLV